ncbi:MAG: L-threonylcarbamoyladenylate synthase [bacterium]
MRTSIIKVKRDLPLAQQLREPVRVLRDGGLVVFPTDTVYGLGCDPRSERAIDAIYEAKGREEGKPLALLLADPADADDLALRIDDVARELMAKFWPGPLTLILRAGPGVPPRLAPQGKVGLRMPDHPVALKLIGMAGTPLATTSANLSGRPAPLDFQGALKGLNGRVDMMIDGGKTHIGRPSTVVDLAGSPPSILRVGAIGTEELREFIGGR